MAKKKKDTVNLWAENLDYGSFQSKHFPPHPCEFLTAIFAALVKTHAFYEKGKMPSTFYCLKHSQM